MSPAEVLRATGKRRHPRGEAFRQRPAAVHHGSATLREPPDGRGHAEVMREPARIADAPVPGGEAAPDYPEAPAALFLRRVAISQHDDRRAFQPAVQIGEELAAAAHRWRKDLANQQNLINRQLCARSRARLDAHMGTNGPTGLPLG